MLGMTGYSYNETSIDNVIISTEIKSVNSRYLDINVAIPPYLNFIDLKIRDMIKNKLNRGKIDINVFLKFNGNNYQINDNLDVAKQYIDNLTKIIKHFKLKDDVRLFHLTKYDDIISVDKKKDYGKYW